MVSPAFEKIVSTVALQFFRWLHESHNAEAVSERESLLKGLTRARVGELFREFLEETRTKKQQQQPNTKSTRNLEGFVMASLRKQKRMRSTKKNGRQTEVICVFCDSDGVTFAPLEERHRARERLRDEARELRSDKRGVCVSREPDFGPHDGAPVLPIHEKIVFTFSLTSHRRRDNNNVVLEQITLTGTHKNQFRVEDDGRLLLATPIPLYNEDPEGGLVTLSFRTNRIAAHRLTVGFRFRSLDETVETTEQRFVILRDILLRSGDKELYGILQPKQPYQKKKRHPKEARTDPRDVLHPPKDTRPRGSAGNGYKGLGPYHIPKNTIQQIENGAMQDSLLAPWKCNDEGEDVDDEEFGTIYTEFWQKLLWASEVQAYEDIRFFDLENVALQKRGRLFVLYVSGLAEGRPSVLRGDLVFCKWQGSKEYRGRVVRVEQLDVLLEFHASFHNNFDVRVDRLDKVRFTFSRTNFRAGHAGILASVKAMGRSLLLPSKPATTSAVPARDCPSRFRWASGRLNEEQTHAITEIVRGQCRPLPYIIFGPPGTGKTTTLVEAIYQLAMLPSASLNILVVAPSNDATDVLVEKLSQYFPPSEMVRVLAFTRSIDQVPVAIRKYCTNGLEAEAILGRILGATITVATINMAARLWCTGNGLPKGHFDVLCIDEAGQATEPEVIAAAATIMDFHKKKNGQLVLAGDPMQLGPIVTSELCQTFQMNRSYLERLVQTSPAYNLEHNADAYPPDRVTLLVNNYRSHPHILKLPNEMFYRNKLIARGDKFQTHGMEKWEHLPAKGFPVLIHAVDGENTREGSSPSWFNPQEAMVVVEYVKNLVRESKPKVAPEDIGIITPYARQVQKIRLALEVSNIGDVKVGSVETFQGQERRVIIISTVRSENSLLQHDLRYNLGFVANEKRFNVAVTRAKALLIVVGNPRVLETDTKNWLPLLRFCKSHGSWLGEDWKEGEGDDSPTASERSEGGDEKVDEDEWAAAAQEGYCFINREE